MIIKIQDGRPQFTDFNLAESAAVRHSELKENKQFTHNRESKTVGLAGRPESACKRNGIVVLLYFSLHYSTVVGTGHLGFFLLKQANGVIWLIVIY